MELFDFTLLLASKNLTIHKGTVSFTPEGEPIFTELFGRYGLVFLNPMSFTLFIVNLRIINRVLMAEFENKHHAVARTVERWFLKTNDLTHKD